MDQFITIGSHREPWNKDKLVGQKAPFKLKEIWAIRVRLQLFDRLRELALFDLAIDSKLRACDLVRLRVRDVSHGDRIAARAIIMQQKTQRPVPEISIYALVRRVVGQWRISGLEPSTPPEKSAARPGPPLVHKLTHARKLFVEMRGSTPVPNEFFRRRQLAQECSEQQSERGDPPNVFNGFC